MARLTVLLTSVLRAFALRRNACLLLFLLGHTACAGAGPLGRLFFSPDERTLLDRGRNPTSGRTAAATETEQITLNGIVRRSSGKNTAWVNQVPQRENETPHGVAIQQGQTSKPSAVLLLPSGKQVQLKAGQTFDATKGKVREGYEDATAAPLPEAAK